MDEQVEHVYGGDVGADPTLPQQDEAPHVKVMAGLATARAGAQSPRRKQPRRKRDAEDE